MSIATAIQAAQQKVADAYTAASAKGATMPATQNLSNLATTISTISGGGVDTTGWIPRAIDANGKLVGSSTMPNFAGVKDLTDHILQYGFYENTALTGALSFPSLTTISGTYGMSTAFQGCTGLTSVSFPALTTISGNYGMSSAFYNCTGLTSVDLSALTTISGNSGLGTAFFGCTRLTSVVLSALTTLSASGGMSYTFRNCTGLISVSFPALKSNSFGSVINQFANMLSGVTGCTIHFPSNLDPQTGSTVISSLSGYPNFGGTNTVLAFDLPATE